MPKAIYLNGQLVPPEQATVSVYDHGLLYGDGVFEGIRVYGGRVFLMSVHVDRLYESAHSIRLEIPMSRHAMAEAIRETVQANDITDGYVRLIVTRGPGALGIAPPKDPKPGIIVIADTITLYPAEFYENGLPLITASTQRSNPAVLSPRVKSLNYLNNIMAKIEGLDAGCPEAVMLNSKGEIAECTGDNLFLVKNGVLRTPPLDAGALEGVTRNCVINLAEQAGIEVRQEPLTRHDVYVADECFLTGTAAEVVPAISLDRRTIGDGKPGSVTKQLLTAFREYTKTFTDD